MHFLFRKKFFSALRSLISFGMKNEESDLDQRPGRSPECWLGALRVDLAESGREVAPRATRRTSGCGAGGPLRGDWVRGGGPGPLGR